MLKRVAVCAMVLLTSARVQAQTTAPASLPTTASSIDPSSPKAALRKFALALDAGDGDAVIALLQADTPQERKLASATADLAASTAELRRAAIAAFGEKTSRPLGVDANSVNESLARIEKATEKVDDKKDRAELRTADLEGPPLVMVRRDGRWKMPVSELSKDVEPADVEKNLADMAHQTKLMRELTAEVKGGKYATAAAARQALDARILQAALPTTSPAPTTQAATQP